MFGVFAADVETEHQLLQLLHAGVAAFLDTLLATGPFCEPVEFEPVRVILLIIGTLRFQSQDRRAGIQLLVFSCGHLLHDTRVRRCNAHLQLHRFEDRERVPLRHGIPRLHLQRHDNRGRRRAHRTAIVAQYPVRTAVDFDRIGNAIVNAERAVRTSPATDAPLEGPQRLDVEAQRMPVDVDPVGLAAVAEHAQLVQVAAVAKFHIAADLGADSRPAAGGGRQEQLAFGVEFLLCYLDCGQCDGDLAATAVIAPLRWPIAIQPANVGRPFDNFAHAQKTQQERPVGRAAPDDNTQFR